MDASNAVAVAVKDDESTHSVDSMASVTSEALEVGMMETGEEDDQNPSSKVSRKKKRTLLAQLTFIFFGMVCTALAIDIFLYYQMEFTVKTVDAILGQDSPDATLTMSLDVSSRMLFSSIDVKSFDCQAFHKTPENYYMVDEDGQAVATVTNDKGFKTNTMIQNMKDADEHFIKNMEITVDNIDFEALKQTIHDSYFTVSLTKTRLECSLNTDVNMLGLVTIPWSDVKRNFEHDCEDCETQGGFENTDIFMASMMMSLISETNTESSRPGEENHERSVSFSENSEEFIFTVNKHVDLSSVLGGVDRFNIEVPSAQYIVASKDKDEFWSTTTTPFAVDLTAQGGSDILSDITTTCNNVVTKAPCAVTDPLSNFLNDLWNGQVKYEMSSASAVASEDSRFGQSPSSIENGRGSSLNMEDNFVESLFGVNVNLDLDLNLDWSDDEDSNRKLVSADSADFKSGSVDIKFKNRGVELINLQVDISNDWSELEKVDASVNMHLYNDKFKMDMHMTVESTGLEIRINELKLPGRSSMVNVDNNMIQMNIDWERDADARKAWLNFVITEEGSNLHKNTYTFPYGKFLDHWNLDLDKFDFDSNNDNSTIMDDSWECGQFTHDDKQGQVMVCYNQKRQLFNMTAYDGDMKKVIGFMGSADGRFPKVFSAEGSAKGDLIFYDQDYFHFRNLTHLRFDASATRHGFDFFIDCHDTNENEVFMSRVMTGWKDMHSVVDMGLTRTQLLLRVDREDIFRFELEDLLVRYKKLDDMKIIVDKLSLTLDNEQIIFANVKVIYQMDRMDVLCLLNMEETEKLYLRSTGLVVYNSLESWNVDITKGLLRLNGEERYRATAKGQMVEVTDSLHDVHAMMDMAMFLAVNKEEYLKIHEMHADMISDGNEYKNLSIASSFRGLIHADETLNATLFVDKVGSEWEISTNNFDVRRSVVLSSAPSSSPTAYPYDTQTILEVTADLNFDTTKNSFDNDPDAQAAATSAFAQSLNEPGATVAIEETISVFTDTGGRRRLAIVEELLVKFKAIIVAETTGTDTTTLFNRMQNAITTSVESGSFNTILSQAFEEFDVTTPFTAAEVVTVNPPVVVNVIGTPTSAPSSVPSSSIPSSSMPSGVPSTAPTAAPNLSSAPTHSPTPAPTMDSGVVTSSDSDSSFSTVNIIIVAVVVPVGILICAVLAYFVMKERKHTAVNPASAMPVGLAE